MKKIDITEWILWFWFAFTLISFVSFAVFGVKLWVDSESTSQGFFLTIFHVVGFLSYPVYKANKI